MKNIRIYRKFYRKMTNFLYPTPMSTVGGGPIKLILTNKIEKKLSLFYFFYKKRKNPTDNLQVQGQK